jgi:hypothetical protein
MGIEAQFAEEDWARIEASWSAWWAGELERPLVMIEGLEPPPGITISNIYELGAPGGRFSARSAPDRQEE